MGSTSIPMSLGVMALVLLCSAQLQGHQPSSDDCVSVRPSNYNGQNKKVAVARCDALEGLANVTDAQIGQLSETVNSVTVTATSNQQNITQILEPLDDLEGDGESLIAPFARPPGGERRRICAVNSLLEVAELCRLELGVRIPNPFFFHLACDDPIVVDVFGSQSCPETFWNLEKGCISVNGDKLPFECLVEPEPGAVCNDIVFISCDGFATAPLDPDTP
ncbi:uncharacterized protein [Littorina saxatilis]|uniref:Uncharacterized protein n=1 Tax=Littorina saxatilis TaxID=31220 RepID=A0AAN9FXS8_9CAEN